MDKFCIITTVRSGSTWLTTLLNSHSELKALPEIFNIYEEYEDGFVSFKKYQKDRQLKRPWATFKYLNMLDSLPGEHKSIGFKVLYDRLSAQKEILGKIVLDRYKIIHLIRENHLDAIISARRAWVNGKRAMVQTTKEVKMEATYIDASSLLEEITQRELRIEKYQKIVNFLPNASLTIAYDALYGNTEKTLSAIANFLKVKDSGISYKSDLKKISKGGYKDKIANYEEIKMVLSGTKFESLLQEK